MSLKGDPYDNAVGENFFNCLKCELIHRKQYPTRASAQPDVFAYLEAFNNTVRPHSALGWLSPVQFESSLLPSCVAQTIFPQYFKDSFCFFQQFCVHFSGKGSIKKGRFGRIFLTGGATDFFQNLQPGQGQKRVLSC